MTNISPSELTSSIPNIKIDTDKPRGTICLNFEKGVPQNLQEDLMKRIEERFTGEVLSENTISQILSFAKGYMREMALRGALYRNIFHPGWIYETKERGR